MPDATAETAMCDGCLSDSDRLCGYCYQCQIRACALEREIANCAHYIDYGCEQLQAFWQMAPEARTNLDAFRVGLAAQFAGREEKPNESNDSLLRPGLHRMPSLRCYSSR